MSYASDPEGSGKTHGARDVQLILTKFPNKWAKSKEELQQSVAQFASDMSQATNSPAKLAMPMVSGMLFGNVIDVESGSYRTLINWLCAAALFADYDGEDVAWLAFAITTLKALNVTFIIITSPSYTPQAPRFRLVIPLCEFVYTMADYQHFMGRLDVLLHGTLAHEFYSTLAYFHGNLIGQPAPWVHVHYGRYFDFVTDHLADRANETMREKLSRRSRDGADVSPAELEADAAVVLSSDIQAEVVSRKSRRARFARNKFKHFTARDIAFSLGGVLRKLTDFTLEAIAEIILDELREAPPPAMVDEDAARDTILRNLKKGAAKPLLIKPYLEALNLGPPYPGPPPNVEPPPNQSRQFVNPFVTELKVLPMPVGTLKSEFETAIQQQALRHGLSYRALLMMLLAAASTMVDKRSRLYPYVSLDIERHKDGPVAALFDVYEGAYWQPPLVWMTFIARPGLRKTFLLEIGFEPVRKVVEHWEKQYRAAHDAWKKDPSKATIPEPKPPRLILAGEGTIQGVEKDLADAPGGLGLARDEGVTLYTMGMYAGSGKAQLNAAAAESGRWNRKFEGKRGGARYGQKESQVWECEGVTIAVMIPLSVILRCKLADREDGFLERMTMMILEAVPEADPTIRVEGWDKIVRAIQRLATEPVRHYRTTIDGAKLILRIERENKHKFGPMEGISEGLRSACMKMHGSIIRYALVLHLLDYPADVEIPVEIPTDTIARAARMVQRCLLPELVQFFGDGLTLADPITVKIKRLIWFSNLDVITRYNLQRAARAMEKWTDAEVNNFMHPFLEWVEPQVSGLHNTRWNVKPGLREFFAKEIEAERAKAAAEESTMKKIMKGEWGE